VGGTCTVTEQEIGLNKLRLKSRDTILRIGNGLWNGGGGGWKDLVPGDLFLYSS
jgi:hypothetical protein